MSSYRANRNGINENTNSEIERADKNNAKNIQNAADVAIASGHPVAAAAGGAVKVVDKLTGGKASEKLGKGLTNVTNSIPGGQRLQEKLNTLNESGVGDAIGKVSQSKNGTAPAEVGQTAEKDKKSQTPSKTPEKDTNAEGETKVEGRGIINIKKILMMIIPAGIIFLLIILIAVAVVTVILGDYTDAIGASGTSGESTGNLSYDTSNKEAKKFYERIDTVKREFLIAGKDVDALKIVAVYHTLHYYNADISYEDMSLAAIREIARAMFEGRSYDENVFADNLANSIFASYFPEYTLEQRKVMAQETLDYIRNYNTLIGANNNNYSSVCTNQGSCDYVIKGINAKNNIINVPVSIKNMKVRLLQCADLGRGEPMEGVKLVDFEKYVLGVVYGETGVGHNADFYKAQAVVSRSYAIARSYLMRGSANIGLTQENGQVILSIRSCTEDQIYCDPDQGCSVAFNPKEVNSGLTVFPGATSHSYTLKKPLAADDPMRAAVSSVIGEYASDQNGYLVYTPYTSTSQHKWRDDIEAGSDYKQALISYYENMTGIQDNTCNINGSTICSVTSTGPFASWKQYQGPWVNIPLGNSYETIRSAGCLATSISMLIAKSGVATTVIGEFNPGTFVQAMNRNGGFTKDGWLNWSTVEKVAPSFKVVSSSGIKVLGKSKEEKMEILSSLLSQGYYIVAEVGGYEGQHWVAIDNIVGDQIIMMDPGSKGTVLWNQYKWTNTSRFVYFKVE